MNSKSQFYHPSHGPLQDSSQLSANDRLHDVCPPGKESLVHCTDLER